MTKIVKHNRFGQAGTQAVNYGRALRTLRAWRGWPLLRLADAIGYAETSLSQWENGVVFIPIHARPAVCQALQFHPKVLEQLASGPHALDELVLLLDGEDNDFVIKLTLDQVAKRAKVNISTLHKYIRLGLVKPQYEGRYPYFTKAQLRHVKELKETAKIRNFIKRVKVITCREPEPLKSENSVSQNM